MNSSRIYILLLLVLIIVSCRKEDDEEIEQCTGNCYLLSELHSKTNHLLPFKLYNDIDSGISKIILNRDEINLKYGHSYGFIKSGFFELIIIHEGDNSDCDTLLFTLGTEERRAAEWGIEAWIPAAFIPQEMEAEEIEYVYPRKYTDGMNVPFIFFIKEGNLLSPKYTHALCTNGDRKFSIKRGEGSFLLPGSAIGKPVNFIFGSRALRLNLIKIHNTDMELRGEISENITIPANTLVHITSDLHILSGASLTVDAGAILLIDEAVNIVNEGPIVFNGEPDNPILVTCSESGKYWGGFISTNADAAISSDYTFFCQSGYHTTGDYQNWGHAGCQALFYTDQSSLSLNHCYILDNKGQIFYPQYAMLTLESIVVQRAKTGGQLNYSDVTIHNSIFTDFPNDSLFYEDNDNDAIYINASDVIIDNCTFMYAKDDGMDSGLNEGGTVTVTNSRFETCFHEGAALSSQNTVVKTHNFSNCTFYNCGQGLELGFSSPNHSVYVDNCQFLNNFIGIRYGDNYDWSIVNGQIFVSNSQSLYNGKDVWNMVRSQWAPKIENMHFQNTQVSAFVDQYPYLNVYATD